MDSFIYHCDFVIKGRKKSIDDKGERVIEWTMIPKLGGEGNNYWNRAGGLNESSEIVVGVLE